mmetsp:Transcript_13235/g.42973  ORF Transcript_13235/g.42973 Transcript_13235/m.42973 type:complete len:205 (-) Transcript_13235:58-672(-)
MSPGDRPPSHPRPARTHGTDATDGSDPARRRNPQQQPRPPLRTGALTCHPATGRHHRLSSTDGRAFRGLCKVELVVHDTLGLGLDNGAGVRLADTIFEDRHAVVSKVLMDSIRLPLAAGKRLELIAGALAGLHALLSALCLVDLVVVLDVLATSHLSVAAKSWSHAGSRKLDLRAGDAEARSFRQLSHKRARARDHRDERSPAP